MVLRREGASDIRIVTVVLRGPMRVEGFSLTGKGHDSSGGKVSVFGNGFVFAKLCFKAKQRRENGIAADL